MSAYKVLIDSSLWIEYFKSGQPQMLDQLIEVDLVCINELILTGLVALLMLKNEIEIVEGLYAFEVISLDIDWNIIRNYQLLNLKKGINKVGILDLIILQQVIEHKISIYSFDKHFLLMQNHLNFELISK